MTPRNEADQSALLVICHGLGDTSDGFDDVAEHLCRKLPYLKIILPTAPTQPVTMNMGMAMPSWYDIKGLDMKSNEQCDGIETSQSRIEQILQTEHEKTGLPYSRMVLAGFSQGGALGLYTGMQLKPVDKKLAGVVVLSGYLPQQSKFTITPGMEDTPILHCHGSQDPVVIYPMAQMTQQALTTLKGATNYELKTFPVQHTVSPQELVAVEEFLRKCLPPDDSCKIKVKDAKEMSIKELKAAIKKAGLSNKATGFCEKSEFIKLVQDHRDGKL
ncbi:Acyl-protein thioesterase [Seminavis robusta]|uniref:Acyl-protein thioesterase n=1 Tax=Seminavis robusta TaxID=568900 RepID=A0A9N8HYQ3_9STRA|nr:Acyl-protein thioesterase [Seminavis robusta]|eukprot:Sro2049_g312560.1 Acyl-protein thioesterase (273) ;mRNA; r:9820-10842